MYAWKVGILECSLKVEMGGAFSLDSKKGIESSLHMPSTSYGNWNTRWGPIRINLSTKVSFKERLLEVNIGVQFSLKSKVMQKVQSLKPSSRLKHPITHS